MEFPDGQVKESAANIIAENMLTQVDSDGISTTLMEAIVDHRRDEEKSLQHHDKYVQTKNGRRHLRKTTKGWELLIKWKDKSESWIKLADMKESHPVEVAEYARARGIDKEPAFKWCVEKSVFSIWVDLLLCRSIQLLVLSYAEIFVYMYLSQLMSTFTELSKGASSSRWYLQSMTRRTSDSTITHMYLYTHVSQI